MAMNDVEELVFPLRSEVLASPKGELSLASRNRLLSAMGEAKFDTSFTPERPERTHGLSRRLRLAELCFERVYPVWQQFVGTRDPPKMLETAHKYLDGQLAWRQAWEIKNTFSGGLQHVYQLPAEGFHAAYVGFAATGILAVPMYDDWHLISTPDEERDDGWDPYFCSGAAYAYELPWGPPFDPERFRAYWLWWLDSAVPVAWNTPDRWW